MLNIVLILGQPITEERAWQCKSEVEADNMVDWLKDNGIDAHPVSLEMWNLLQAKWQKDNS